MLTSESLKPVLIKERSKYPAKPTDYLTHLTKNLANIPVEALLSRGNAPMSIFSPAESIDPRVALPTTMDPNVFKRIARVYLTGKDFSNLELEDVTKNLSVKEYGVDQVEKRYNIGSSDTLAAALVKTTQNAA